MLKFYKPGSGAFQVKYNTFSRFDAIIAENMNLDSATAKLTLKVAPSVVCLTSHIGHEQLFICSGTIVESEKNGSQFIGTILTSATLVRCSVGVADAKINVFLAEGKSVEGHLLAADFHFNVAVVRIVSDAPFSVAAIRFVDDSMALEPLSVSDDEVAMVSRVPQLLSDNVCDLDLFPFKLYPEDGLLALGRYFKDSYHIMAAPGSFRNGCCRFECKELLRASCRITKNGIGGPVVNNHGEVIGISFYDPFYTPFLPMNIAIRCLNQLKKNECVPQPWLGVKGTNLCEASLGSLEIMTKICPEISKGLLVREVECDSPAYFAGIQVNDVIVRCDGNTVGSILELTESLLGKIGSPVKMIIVRENTAELLKLTVKSVATCRQEYSWPVPEVRTVLI